MSEPIAKTHNLLPFQRVFIHELSLVSTSYFKSLAHTIQYHTMLPGPEVTKERLRYTH